MPAAPEEAPAASTLSPAEVAALRADFAVLARTVGDDGSGGAVPLVYLDSGATSQRPGQVLDAERRFAEHSYGAVHRGAHTLAAEATEAFEDARETVAGFVGMPAESLVWTRNATEALNLLAYALSNPTAGNPAGELALRPGDEVVVTEAEHHANLVPWQQACARSGATLRWIPLDDDGRLDLTDLDSIVNERTRVLAFAHVSNVLGTIAPVQWLVARAKAATSGRALTVLDACQSVPHFAVSVPDLGVDAIAFSGHKMLGPTGIGALVARPELLAALPPVLTGGSMVEKVTMETATFRAPPQRFEAGTQPVAQAVALAAAVGYLRDVGMDRIEARERELTKALLDGVASVPGVQILGPVEGDDKIAVVSFAVDGVHPHDVGQVLDEAGIAVRVGHHCAQPVHRRFGVTASTRASAYLYTSDDDVAAFVAALRGVRPFFGLSDVPDAGAEGAR